MAITKVSRGLLNTGVSDSSDATAITISSDENVGIKTTSPIYDLQIGTYGTDADSSLAIATATDGSGNIRFGDGTSGVNANQGKIVYDHSVNAMQFWTSVTERMRIDSSGNVGIGTTSPTANLHVSGSSAQKIDITDTSGASTRISTANSKSYVGSTTNHPLLFLTNDTERMRIDTSGTLFIGGTAHYSGGSNADDATLAVNGSIVRKGVSVTDFDEAYVGVARGILEGTSTYQATKNPSTEPTITGAGNFFYVVARTVATSGSASNNYILQVAYGLTGLQYTRYSSNNGSTWSNWIQRTT